jgi:CHAT domain-containing protein/Tfp pilus assembly protein PilF
MTTHDTRPRGRIVVSSFRGLNRDAIPHELRESSQKAVDMISGEGHECIFPADLTADRGRDAVRPAISPPVRVGARCLALIFLLATGTLPGWSSLPVGEDAWAQLARGNVEDAAALAEEILAGDPGNARAAFCLAEALTRLERDEDAVARFQAATTTVAGARHVGLAEITRINGNPAEAESLLMLALAQYRAGENTEGEVVSLERLGHIALRDGRPEEAAARYNEALVLAQDSGLPMAVAFAHSELGRALLHRREVEGAEEHLLLAIQEAERLDLPRWQGDAEITVSVLYRWQMDLDRSLQHRESALRSFERAGNLSGQARSLHYIAAIHLFRGELTQAMSWLHRGLEKAREAEDRDEESGCLGDLGAVNYLLGDFERALQLTKEAVRLGGDTRPKGWVAGTLGNIGTILTDQNRHGEALEYFDRALSVMREAGDHRNEAGVLDNIGNCLCEMGRSNEGIQRLEEAVALAREWKVPKHEAYSLLDMGFCNLGRGDLKSAGEDFAEAGRLAQAIGFFDVQESVLRGEAILAKRKGQNAEALRFLEEAMSVAEGVRRRSTGSSSVQSRYFSQGSITYQMAVDILHDMYLLDPSGGLDAEAFNIAQRAKGRSFLDMLAEAEVDLRCRADPQYQEREAAILARVAELINEKAGASEDDQARLGMEIARLEEEIALVEADLRAADPRYAELQYPHPSTLEDVQGSVLTDGELLLEYFLGDSASYVWAVTPRSFRIVRLSGRGEIEAGVRRLLPLLLDYNLLGPDAAYFAVEAGELSSSLLGPVAGELQGARRVIIAPHGILHYLPFEALLVEPEERGEESHDFSTLPYLATRADVIYIPSISALAQSRAARGEAKRPPVADLLLVGNPETSADAHPAAFARAVMGDAVAPAPHAREEVSGLRALFPEDRCVVLERKTSTVANVTSAGEAGPYRLVHFAAHGVFNERRPQFSGLILSPDDTAGDDGFLTIGQVFGLNLDCNQVVLSACSSALGEEISGEGLVGLTRAFLYAGASSVVAALWEVSGRATSTFMMRLYGELGRDESLDGAHALAETKRWMIQNPDALGSEDISLAHPYFWAAFVMTGDTR